VLRGTSDGGDQFAALALDQDGDRPALLHLWYCGD
jgi:hypothetical protein